MQHTLGGIEGCAAAHVGYVTGGAGHVGGDSAVREGRGNAGTREGGGTRGGGGDGGGRGRGGGGQAVGRGCRLERGGFLREGGVKG